jgi:hypothetical protein
MIEEFIPEITEQNEDPCEEHSKNPPQQANG